MGTWRYNRKTRQYESEDGIILSHPQMVSLRDTFSASRKDATVTHSKTMTGGEITLQQWESLMRGELRTAFVDMFVLGRGGRKMMTYSDWGVVGNQLRTQYRYLSGFAQEVATGTMSEAEIANRATLYMEASTQAYERGYARAFGLPTLSQVPGDGRTQCGVRCKCQLEITEDETNWYVKWILGPVKKKHCDDCDRLSRQWNPLTLPKAG